MNTLAQFQSDFLQSVFEQNTPAKKPDVLNHIQAQKNLPAHAQYEIYRQSIFAGLVGALEQIYPVCRTLTGEGFFYAMARAYIRKQPSRSANLAQYGSNLSDFISRYTPADTVPYLADMARLEWACHLAFYAADEPATCTGLEQYSENQLLQGQFLLAGSHHFIRTDYPIDIIWNAHQQDIPDELHIAKSPIMLLVFRTQYEIHIDRLTINEFYFLRQLQQQDSFYLSCEQCHAIDDLGALLANCLQRGWVNRFQP